MTDDMTQSYETPGAAEEAAGGPAANLAPVAVAPGPKGPSRARLLAGLGIAGLVLALTAGGVILLAGSSTPEALKYIPGDAAFVGELRMDLPGDQMQNLGNLLAHFPGFADQATLGEKIDEAFGRVVSTVSEGEADYVTDVKPWLNGPFFVSASVEAIADDSGAVEETFLAAATTNGAVVCDTTFEGQATSKETYKEVELTLTTDGKAACAIDGRFALAGDPASVRSAIDTKAAGTGMDGSTRYQEARRTLSGEQLATLWFDGAALRTVTPAPDPSMGIPGLDGLGDLAGQIPDWFILGLRAESEAIVIDAAAGPTSGSGAVSSLLPVPAGHASALVGLVPADTLVYIEHQAAGVSIQNLMTNLRSIPELQAPLQMLDGLARPEDLVGWIEDAAIAVSAQGADASTGSLEATVLLVASDATAASERVTTLRSVFALMAMSGEGITIADTTIGDTTATTVTIADLAALIPPGTIPDAGELPTGEVSFSFASRDQVLYLTVGDGTMAKVLGLQAGASLADSAAFKQLVPHGLANSQTTAYVAIGTGLDFVEPFLPEALGPTWATDMKPYVDPIEALGTWTTSDASGTRFRTVITVTGP